MAKFCDLEGCSFGTNFLDYVEHNGAALQACAIDTGLAPHSKNPESAEKLWTLSEKLVGQEFRY